MALIHQIRNAYHLKNIYIVQYPPTFIINKKADGSSEYGGPTFESLAAIAEILQLRYKLIELNIKKI